MKRKGFTLIEVLLSLSLIGLIAVTTLPILTSSLLNINKTKVRLEMNYIGEMVMERIKSFNEEGSPETYICHKKVSEIIYLFRNQNIVELNLNEKKDDENYLIKIIKKERADRLWIIEVYVYHDKEGSNLNHVEYKTYILKK